MVDEPSSPPSAVITTVPPVLATLPKLKSTDFRRVIGLTISAVAVAVASSCAKAAPPRKANKIKIIFS